MQAPSWEPRKRGRLPRLRRATAVPRGGTVSELSLVVDSSAGACAPSVGASVRLMSGDMRRRIAGHVQG